VKQKMPDLPPTPRAGLGAKKTTGRSSQQWLIGHAVFRALLNCGLQKTGHLLLGIAQRRLSPIVTASDALRSRRQVFSLIFI
jgi:hypothetical protein